MSSLRTCIGAILNENGDRSAAVDAPCPWRQLCCCAIGVAAGTIATTYDGGNTWFVANTTPDNPIQGAFAGFSNAGDGRNHYDFIDATIDTQGRVIASNSIGCSAACVNNGGPNTFAKLGGIVLQSGGRRMLAAFDPHEPAQPAAPLLSGYRTATTVVLNWPMPDNNGA